jgi:hypothetical protein
MIDLVVHAGTKLALEQWLQARGLGESYQDVEPESPTFGEWFYRHTDPDSTFIWWRHPVGKMEATPTTFFQGFYGILRFRETISIEGWVRNNTALSILDGFTGYGGEGITVVTPDKVNDHLDAQGIPRHEFAGGMEWSDPRVWWASPVMIGDLREIDGVTYASLIDFNVWSPLTSPQLWEVQEPEEPAIPAWTPWPGFGPLYQVGAQVTHNGQTWQATTGNNVWEPGVFGWVVV